MDFNWSKSDAVSIVRNPQKDENGLDKGDIQEGGEKWLGLECILRKTQSTRLAGRLWSMRPVRGAG